MEKLLKAEYDFYLNNKKELMKKYKDKYVAIQGTKVIGSGEDKVETVKRLMYDGYKLGEFLVHLVSKDSDEVQRFYSRVV